MSSLPKTAKLIRQRRTNREMGKWYAYSKGIP
jgi:hypothetical protein